MELRNYQRKVVEWAKEHDGIVIAPAGSGKTIISASIVQQFLNKKPEAKIGWLAPTRETCTQAISALNHIIGSSAMVEVCCPYHTVDFSKKDMVIVDECKHAVADTWKRIITECTGLRYGFDATPWCDDPQRNYDLKNLFRNQSIEITRAEVGENLCDAYIRLSDATDSDLEGQINDNIERLFRDRRRYMRIGDDELKAMCAWESITDIGIANNKARNQACMDFALVNHDKQVLILVPRITLGEEYVAQINGTLVHSKMPRKDRKKAMADFKAGQLKCMVATSLADEGLDLPNAEVLIMVSGGRSTQKTIQRAARVLRATEEKDFATILDFRDKFHPIAMHHAYKRMRIYKQMGCIFK